MFTKRKARKIKQRLFTGFRNSEFTLQDGRKKRTAKRLCVTNVTLLLLASFVLIFTWALQKDPFNGK